MTNKVFYLSCQKEENSQFDKLRMACHNAEVMFSSESSNFEKNIKSIQNLKALVIDSLDVSIIDKFKKIYSEIPVVLLNNQSLLDLFGSLKDVEIPIIDHIVSTSICKDNYITIVMQKILTEDILGIEKYLKPGSSIQVKDVIGSESRQTLNLEMKDYIEHIRLPPQFAKKTLGITEELLMNAIYDAPRSVAPDHPTIEHTIVLKKEHQSKLFYGCDGEIFLVGVRDPFGTLTSNHIFRYLKKVLYRNDDDKLIDTKKGGAGLGLLKMLFGSHALICNVRKNVVTEVFALMFLDQQIKDFPKMPRSVSFFYLPK